jgi:hypothetical protein
VVPREHVGAAKTLPIPIDVRPALRYRYCRESFASQCSLVPNSFSLVVSTGREHAGSVLSRIKEYIHKARHWARVRSPPTARAGYSWTTRQVWPVSPPPPYSALTKLSARSCWPEQQRPCYDSVSPFFSLPNGHSCYLSPCSGLIPT